MKFEIEDGRQCFWQWDLNQRLIITGRELPFEVHFGNVMTSRAPVVDAYEEDGRIFADVPNLFFQDSMRICAYVYVTEDGQQRTECADMFTVLQRPKPDDYVYTETEVKRWEDLENRIRELEQNGGGSPGVGSIPIATAEKAGIVIVGDNLTITESGVLSVTTSDTAQQDNTRPITSAAVYTELGNINVLLGTI